MFSRVAMTPLFLRPMKFYVCAFAALLPGLVATAQYNDSVHYYTAINSNGTLNKTATNSSYVLSNSVKLGVRHRDLEFNSANSWLFGEQQKKLINNDVNISADVNLYKTFPHFYYWGLGTFTSSYSLKINSQYQAGVGIAYHFIDKKTANINISDGILYENSDITLKDTMRQHYSTYRNSLRLQFRWVIKDIIKLRGVNFWQPSLANSSDYVIKSSLSLGVAVNKWLSLTTSYTYNKFSRTGRENTLFNYGLMVEKYF